MNETLILRQVAWEGKAGHEDSTRDASADADAQLAVAGAPLEASLGSDAPPKVPS